MGYIPGFDDPLFEGIAGLVIVGIGALVRVVFDR